MRPCSMKEQREDSGARDRGAEEEESREREVNIKVHSLKRLVTPLILYLLTQHERDTGSPTVCFVCAYLYVYVCVCMSEKQESSFDELAKYTHSRNELGH